MSEQPGDNQELEGNRQGTSARVILAIIVTVLLSGIVSWVFVPSVRVLGYQTILMVGPVSARRWSVKKLEGYKELAVRPLAIALKDKDKWVRANAAEALWKIGPKAEKAIPALIQALKDKDKDVCGIAALTLGKIGRHADMSDHGPAKAEKAVPALIEALKNKDEDVRYNVNFSLVDIGPKAVPALIKALKDKEELARESAAIVLGEMSPKAEKAVPALSEALKDKNKYVRKAAKEALEKIQKK
jgi:HEAT repeat protein